MVVWIIVIALVVLALGGLIAMLVITAPIAKNVYHTQLVRTSPDKWLRVCSAPDNEEQLAMWNAGVEWANANKDAMKEVSIEHDGLKLYGEFYDFGSDKCVLISPGRCECLIYSYYFASPYKEAGMNGFIAKPVNINDMMELLAKDEYDFIVVYNGNYDAEMHRSGPESAESLAELRMNDHVFSIISEYVKRNWKNHNTLIGWAMDHGCHEIDGGAGSHGLDMPEDINIMHCYKAYCKEV